MDVNTLYHQNLKLMNIDISRPILWKPNEYKVLVLKQLPANKVSITNTHCVYMHMFLSFCLFFTSVYLHSSTMFLTHSPRKQHILEIYSKNAQGKQYLQAEENVQSMVVPIQSRKSMLNNL